MCIRSTAEVLRGADVDAKTAEKLGAFHVWSVGTHVRVSAIMADA